MKQWIIFSFLLLFCCALTLTYTDTSEAARMGGGRSFGSAPAMRSPTPAPRPTVQQPRQQTMNPSTMAPRPSSGMGAMGGLFGGLLAGTLLGSLLGGGHAGVAGAGGGGLGLFDILILGALIYFGFKMYRKMKANQQQQEPSYEQGYGYQDQQNMQYQDTSWDAMRSSGGGTGAFGGPVVPPDFNVDEFLQGAKAAYVRMQSSWDQRDLNDISQFATPVVMETLREQLKEDPNPSRTEIINLSAQLMGVTTEGNLQRAQVYFDALLRERPEQVQAEPAREVWHFMRTLPDGTWKLDGIQQTY